MYRLGDYRASVELRKGLTIGLHPGSGEMPTGRRGSMAIGLELGGVSIEDLAELKWSHLSRASASTSTHDAAALEVQVRTG